MPTAAEGLLQTNFTAVDWVIVAVYLAGSLAIGILANRFIHSLSDYLVSGRGSGAALNSASYLGTSFGLVTLMYASMEGFTHGFSYLTLALILFVVLAFLGSTGFVIHELRRLKLLTIPEYFQRRFDRRARLTAGVICVVSGLLNMGLFPKLGAKFIAYSSGLATVGADGLDNALLINLIMSLLIVLVLVYTVLGGMLSVIITDYVQFIVLSLGLGVGVYCCLIHPELGWEGITSAMGRHRGPMMFNPVAEGGYGWIWIIYMCVLMLTATICWAPEISRALTARHERATLQTFLMATPGGFVRLGIPAFWGAAAFCLVANSPALSAHFFPHGLAGGAEQASEAMPMALGYVVPSGLLGLLVAGLMAAFMSTNDSYLLCWASVVAHDVAPPLANRELSGRQQILVTRVSLICMGVFLLVWGIWYELPESVWNYMAVTGTIYISGTSVALIGGIYWRGASSVGAFAAMLAGLVGVAGLFVPKGNDPLKHTIGLATFGFCAVVFVVFSLLFPDHRQEAEAEVP